MPLPIDHELIGVVDNGVPAGTTWLVLYFLRREVADQRRPLAAIPIKNVTLDNVTVTVAYSVFVADSTRYAIGDLADLGGVSRRTVRYYVQEGLLPQPLGLGRGHHYGKEHLAQLLRVKRLQEAGRTLDEIRSALGQKPERAAAALMPRRDAAQSRSLWRRIELAPGVELHVSANNRLPGPAKLEELASWCRLNCPGGANGEDDAEN